MDKEERIAEEPENKERFQRQQFRKEAGEDIRETEFAAEVAPAPPVKDQHLNEPEDNRPEETARRELPEDARGEAAEDTDGTIGWFAFILAIASLFIWPAVLGPAGAIFGFVAYRQGNRAFGIWSIVIGLISFLAYTVFVPLYT